MEGETVAANGTSRRRVDDGEQRVKILIFPGLRRWRWIRTHPTLVFL